MLDSSLSLSSEEFIIRIMCTKQVKPDEAKTANGEDRINNLPNDLLIHILSCLSTKDAVKTSILSRKWKLLWAFVPVLEFKDDDFSPKGDCIIDQTSRKAKFSNFIYQFFWQKDPSSIRKLQIKGSQSYDLSLVYSWIYLAKERQVQELQLEIYYYHNEVDIWPYVQSRMFLVLSIYHFDPQFEYEKIESFSGKLSLKTDVYCDNSDLEPWTILAKEWNIEELKLDFAPAYRDGPKKFPDIWFNLEMLKVLKLQGYDMLLDLPLTSMSFPHIKVLHLWGILFKDSDSASTFINHCCPVLEELDIRRHDDDSMTSLIISSHTLKRLTLNVMAGNPTTNIARKIRINAPALENLNIKDEVTQEYYLEDVGMLVDEAKLNVGTTYHSNFLDRTRCTAFDLLNKICNVKCLTLSDYTMMALHETYSYDLPTFYLMTRLKIVSNFYNPGDKTVTWNLVLKFLKKSPQLEVLHIEGIVFGLGEEFMPTLSQDVPNCVVSRLKTIELNCLSFKEDEMKIVGYFLKNCSALKNLNIRIKGYSAEEKEVGVSVLALPRGSSECHIEIGGVHDFP